MLIDMECWVGKSIYIKYLYCQENWSKFNTSKIGNLEAGRGEDGQKTDEK